MTDGGQFTFKIFDGRTLNNAGTAVWNAGFVIAFNGAVINNLTGATFKAQSGYDLIYGPHLGKGGVSTPGHVPQRRHLRQDGRHAPQPV